VSTHPVLRIVEREALVFARLVARHRVSTFVAPALFLGAIGVGLGGLVKAHTGAVDGLNLSRFRRARSARRSAMQLAASERSGRCAGAVKWMRQFTALVATPISPDSSTRFVL